MKRLYEPAAYVSDPGTYWAETYTPTDWPRLSAPLHCDVAIIGGGFTGLNTAISLAEAGLDVAVFDTAHPGWGASGRNGGFCCLGGALATERGLTRQYGADEAALWEAAQAAAVHLVAQRLDQYGIAADVHSDGETVLAHSARAWRSLQKTYAKDPDARLMTPPELTAEGLGGPWHGGVTVPAGFALNPQKYHGGLAQAAARAGAQIFAQSPVTQITGGPQWTLRVNGQDVRAGKVVIATNGYSSEDVPPWLSARTLPVQSSIIVTRPLTDDELAAAGWWSAQMAYDSRSLLHYFRLLPERRFLFGMRGGLRATERETADIARRIRRDFAAAFPAWAQVEITHEWSGLVCLMARGTPFVGSVPDHPGLFAALGFHGNGVAMGSYAGHLLGSLVRGVVPEDPMPTFLSRPPARFPLGRHRRLLLRPAYLLAEHLDL